jgi:hypothetical protein
VQGSAGRRWEIGPAVREMPRKGEKDTKIEGTNSITPLESAKVPKNELKTNCFLSAKKAQQSQKGSPQSTFCVPLSPNSMPQRHQSSATPNPALLSAQN